MHTRSWLKISMFALMLIFALSVLFLLLYPYHPITPTAFADEGGHSHFRFGHITWEHEAGDPPYTARITLLYSTYFGGSKAERGFDLALGGADQVYVTGFTQSSNFPLANAYDSTYAGGTCGTRNCYDAFAFKLDLATNTLVYSTYLGGGSDDEGNGITVDGSGSAYLTGYTKSTDFPVASAIQSTKGSDGCGAPPCADAFITKLDASGSSLAYSTYLGGSGDDYGQAVVLDGLGGAYVTGYTLSSDFPTTPGSYSTVIGSTYKDAFVVKISD